MNPLPPRVRIVCSSIVTKKKKIKSGGIALDTKVSVAVRYVAKADDSNNSETMQLKERGG